MIAIVVDIILLAMLFYLLIGFIFSVYFLIKGAEKMDKDVKDSPWHFKLIIWPGTVLLWGFLVYKMVRK